jgi:transposase-like protein
MSEEKKNKKWPTEFKTKVVQEYLTGKYTVKELAKKYGFEHDPTRVYKWRHEFNQVKQGLQLEELKTLSGAEQARRIQELEAEVLEYQKKLAEQFVINDLLKKHHGLKTSAHVRSVSGLTDTIKQLGPNKKRHV